MTMPRLDITGYAFAKPRVHITFLASYDFVDGRLRSAWPRTHGGQGL
jgi:hypothetical protein